MSNGSSLSNNDQNNSPQRSAGLSEDVADEPISNSREMTNAHLNLVIEYPLTHIELTQVHAVAHRFPWPLVLSMGEIQALIDYNGYSGTVSQRNQSRHPLSLLEPYHSDWMRNAQAEGRTSQPTDSDIGFSSTVQMLPSVPLGVENTQGHDVGMLTDMNTVESENPVNAHALDEANFQAFIGENSTQQFIINHAGVINTFVPVEPQEDVHSSDSNDEGSSLGSESGNDGDDENDSDDAITAEGQTTPPPPIHVNPTQNDPGSNPTYHTIGSTTGITGSNGPQNQANEIDLNVHYPAAPTHQLILPPPRLTCIIVPKAHHRPQVHGVTSDEYID